MGQEQSESFPFLAVIFLLTCEFIIIGVEAYVCLRHFVDARQVSTACLFTWVSRHEVDFGRISGGSIHSLRLGTQRFTVYHWPLWILLLRKSNLIY